MYTWHSLNEFHSNFFVRIISFNSKIRRASSMMQTLVYLQFQFCLISVDIVLFGERNILFYLFFEVFMNFYIPEYQSVSLIYFCIFVYRFKIKFMSIFTLSQSLIRKQICEGGIYQSSGILPSGSKRFWGKE